MRLLIGTLVACLVMPAVALAGPVCDGVTDDTAAIQTAVDSATPLPAGTCAAPTGVIVVGCPGELVGQGLRTTLVGHVQMFVTATCPTRPIVRDLVISGMGGIGLEAVGEPGPQPTVDRYQIERVFITGTYGLAFACVNVASSLMQFVQVWNYQPDTFAAAFLTCSDWTLLQVEVHEQAPSAPGGALWLWFGTAAIRMIGGNLSLHGPGQYVVGPGLEPFGTTVYVEP